MSIAFSSIHWSKAFLGCCLKLKCSHFFYLHAPNGKQISIKSVSSSLTKVSFHLDDGAAKGSEVAPTNFSCTSNNMHFSHNTSPLLWSASLGNRESRVTFSRFPYVSCIKPFIPILQLFTHPMAIATFFSLSHHHFAHLGIYFISL